MIPRELAKSVKKSLEQFPVCAVIGSRQVGKTTLAIQVAEELYPGRHVRLDLENPQDLNRLSEPQLYLERHRGKLILIDEVQRKPDLFPLLRFLADQGGYHFFLLGSSSPELMRQSSESLAGRIEYLELPPLTLEETGLVAGNRDALWLRGGYPKSYLAPDDDSSYRWRSAFVQTFLERDLPQFGIRVPAATLRRFWQMTAHFHGQIWNAQKIAQSMDISSPTSKHYLDILEHTFILRTLQPYVPNVKKRLVKSPKVYFRDSGLLHHALDVMSHEALLGHPTLGASWEGFAVEQIIRRAPGFSRFFFYRTAAGAEVDLVEIRPDRKPILYEMKHSLSPKPTRGLRSAMQDLASAAVYLVYPGSESYPIEPGIKVLSLLQSEP
jgi:uncharacterized protein